VHGGLLGEYCEKNTELLLSAIFNALREGEADFVLFNHLPVESLLYKRLIEKTPFLWRDYSETRSIHWKITLSWNFSDFLQRVSSKTRYNLRRTERSLEKAFTGRVLVKKFVDEPDIQRFAADAEKVAKTGYQRGLGVGFVDNDEMRHRLRLMANRGLLRSYILYAGDVPCAFWMATKYCNRVFLDSTGYNPDYKKYEVGTILFLKMIEDLCQDKTVKEIDFGLGHASYKERFGDTKSDDCTMFVFAPRVKGIFFNLLRTINSIISTCAQRFLLKIGLYDQFKKKMEDIFGEEHSKNSGKRQLKLTGLPQMNSYG
jgi:hypothetical protein